MRFLLLYCVIGGVCFFQDLEACEYREYRIACVGDSVTTGHYPKVLEKLLGDNVEVRVYAQKGLSVSSVMMEELYDALENWNPTHVVFYAGINDCVEIRADYAEHDDEKNSEWVMFQIDHAIEWIQDRGAQAIIVKHHPWSGYRKRGYECSKCVNEWLDGERFVYDGAIVVETMLLGNGDKLRKSFDAGDGLHLNYEGDKVLAGLVAEAIQ